MVSTASSMSGPTGRRWRGSSPARAGAGTRMRWSSLSTPIRSAWSTSAQSWSSDGIQNTGTTGASSTPSSDRARATAESALWIVYSGPVKRPGCWPVVIRKPPSSTTRARARRTSWVGARRADTARSRVSLSKRSPTTRARARHASGSRQSASYQRMAAPSPRAYAAPSPCHARPTLISRLTDITAPCDKVRPVESYRRGRAVPPRGSVPPRGGRSWPKG